MNEPLKNQPSKIPISERIQHAAELAKAERELALKCWYLTGATASGKSQISIELAKKLDAEIISLDSMAIYRDMNIGTAKPSIEQQGIIPHHLVDILDPTETFSVSQFRIAALAKIREIFGRDKQVLFVGGTALYLKAVVRGLFEGPPADWEFRKQIESDLADCNQADLMRRLESVDPVAADKLHENDRRRIIRALEVYYRTGVPISHWQIEFETATPSTACKVFTLRHPRAILHSRIEQRVHEMFERGLIQEVEDLIFKFGELSHTAAQAVGYRECIEFLNGARDRESTFERVLVRTRRFARHQETWFRGLEECEILDLGSEFDCEAVVEQLYKAGHERN